MIKYNPQDWFTFIFKFHKADTFRKLLPAIILMCLYAWGVVYLETGYLKLGESSHAKNLTILHSLLGFAISMLLVFRTNTAYDRSLLASAKVPAETVDAVRKTFAEHGEELLAAITATEENEKYIGGSFDASVTDADYDGVRKMFVNVGVTEFTEFVGQ